MLVSRSPAGNIVPKFIRPTLAYTQTFAEDRLHFFCTPSPTPGHTRFLPCCRSPNSLRDERCQDQDSSLLDLMVGIGIRGPRPMTKAVDVLTLSLSQGPTGPLHCEQAINGRRA